MSVIQDIKKRGYWFITLRPPEPLEKEISLETLEKAVRQSVVSLRGWDFPHFNPNESVRRSSSYVSQEVSWKYFRELWRAYRSGQLVSVQGIRDDWRDESSWWPPDRTWRQGGDLSVEDSVYRLVEIFEFASRYYQRIDGVGMVWIRVEIFGLRQRALTIAPNRIISRPRVCSEDRWEYKVGLRLTDLVAEPGRHAAAPAVRLFELFGFDVDESVVLEIQDGLRR